MKDGNAVYHQHFTCKDCLPPLQDIPIKNFEPPPKIQQLINCPLIFSSLDKSLCEIPMNCLVNVERVEPNPDDPQISLKAAHAASLVVVGEMSNLSTPILQSGLKYQHREGNLVCLTVGFFLRIEIKKFFERLMVVWVLDNLDELIKVADDYDTSLEESVEILLERVPDKSWDLLKPYLCLSEVQKDILANMDCRTTSSELPPPLIQ